MKKTSLVAIAFAIFATGCTAIAADESQSRSGMMGQGGMMGKGGMMGQGGMMGKGGMMDNMMKKMDTNSDGMLSKDEFMKGHEQVFDRMKGQNGMVAMNEMPMNCMAMMGGQGGMMGDQTGGEKK